MKAPQSEIQELLEAVKKDKKIYKELFDAGELSKPVYNPIMKKCHEENADLLEKFIDKYGWPFPKEYGEEPHEAAWFIAIHAISRPALIKKIAKIMYDAWKLGKVAGKYYANFYDRIELYEGRKQLYGTHLYPSKTGWYAGDLKNPETVNQRRKEIGLSSLEEWIKESEEEGSGFEDVDEESYQKEFDIWCKQTGWRNETPVWTQTIFIEQELAKDIVNVIEAYLKSAVSIYHFSGVVMIAKHGKIILNQGYGMATTNDKNEQNSIFHVGSITKQFTAAAIMKLWESGKINLQVSINEYLPKEYQSENWNKVTIHHLLSHTSGIPDYDDAKYYDQKMMGFCFSETVKKIVKEASQKKLEFEPGSKWNYCNVGYTLLGIILENLTGQNYSDIIQNYFLKPLGMTSTSFHEENYVGGEVHSKGFRWDKEDNKWVEDTEKILTTVPDGGMISTCEDLYKWSIVLEGKRPDILSHKILQLMTTPIVHTCTPYGDYGYGLYIDNSSGATRIYHSGWIVGFTSNFSVYPKKELFITVLSNNTTNDTTQIVLDLQKIVFEQIKN